LQFTCQQVLVSRKLPLLTKAAQSKIDETHVNKQHWFPHHLAWYNCFFDAFKQWIKANNKKKYD